MRPWQGIALYHIEGKILQIKEPGDEGTWHPGWLCGESCLGLRLTTKLMLNVHLLYYSCQIYISRYMPTQDSLIYLLQNFTEKSLLDFKFKFLPPPTLLFSLEFCGYFQKYNNWLCLGMRAISNSVMELLYKSWKENGLRQHSKLDSALLWGVVLMLRAALQ